VERAATGAGIILRVVAILMVLLILVVAGFLVYSRVAG